MKKQHKTSKAQEVNQYVRRGCLVIEKSENMLGRSYYWRFNMLGEHDRMQEIYIGVLEFLDQSSSLQYAMTDILGF